VLITETSSDAELKGIINRKFKLSEKAKNVVGWAFVNSDSRLHDEAKTLSGDEANDAFLDAFKKYTQAIKIKPNFHKALYNWGILKQPCSPRNKRKPS
jgi:hypothetical protein